MSAGSAADWHDDSDVPKMELLDACYRSDMRKVEMLLKEGVPVDATDDDLVTPLQIAAFTGNRDLALLLLDAGADIEAHSRIGMTALHHACREGKMEVVDLLMQKGADIQKFTRMGASALTLAAAGGHLEVVKKLVGLQVPVSAAKDICPTPLITAVFRNFSPICVYLVSKGAPIDACLDQLLGLSALSCSIFTSNRSMLITLLDRGADPEKKTFKKKTAWELARFDLRRDDVCRTLHERRSGRSIERKDVRQALLEDDFDPKELIEQRQHLLPFEWTPLHFSVAIGNMNAVRCLVYDGKLIDEAERHIGLSPLQIAALLGQTDVLSHLVDKGASTTYMNSLKMTAFDCYVANGGEPNEQIRTALHPFRPKKSEWSLGGSSTSLAKVFPTKSKEWFSKRLTFSDRPLELPPVEAKQWRETRMHTFAMHGRNYKKLVTVENLLFGDKSLKPKKCNGDDTVMDVMFGIAEEAKSFTVTCFYDWYTGGEKKKEIEITKDLKSSGGYDNALKFSVQYGYPKHQPPRYRVNRDTPVITFRDSLSDRSSLLRERSDTDPWRHRLNDGRKEMMPPSRTTPRTLKKQRDSMTYEDLRHQELRKTNSTGQLQMPSVVAPRPRFATANADNIKDIARMELQRRNMLSDLTKFDEAELEGWQLHKLTIKDYEEMGISQPAAKLLNDTLRRDPIARPTYQASYH